MCALFTQAKSLNVTFIKFWFCFSAGEIQYRQRLEDIRLLKLEIKKLRREKNILTKSVANVEDLRYEAPFPAGCNMLSFLGKIYINVTKEFVMLNGSIKLDVTIAVKQ